MVIEFFKGDSASIIAEFKLPGFELRKLIYELADLNGRYAFPAEALREIAEESYQLVTPLLISENELAFVAQDGSHFECELSDRMWNIRVRDIEADSLSAVIKVVAGRMFSKSALAERVYTISALAEGAINLCRTRGYYTLTL